MEKSAVFHSAYFASSKDQLSVFDSFKRYSSQFSEYLQHLGGQIMSDRKRIMAILFYV